MGAGSAVRGSVILLALLQASGCATVAHQGESSAAAGAALVSVRNNNWADMNVYLLRSGSRFRLGTVGAATSRTFRLPEATVASTPEVQLLADPIGGARAYVSPGILVGRGEQIVWTIENTLALSSLRVEQVANR
jgi:hypothetical protein